MLDHADSAATPAAAPGPAPAVVPTPGPAPTPVPAGAGWAPAVEAPPPGRVYRWTMAVWTKPSWLAPLAVLACLGTAFSYVLANNPTDAKADPLGPCAFKLVTGLDCPGCGGTRMVWYLLHGDLVQAFRHHAVAFLAIPVLVWAYLVWGARRVFGVRLPSKQIPIVAIAVYLATWMVYSVLRNLPWPPFEWFFVS